MKYISRRTSVVIAMLSSILVLFGFHGTYNIDRVTGTTHNSLLAAPLQQSSVGTAFNYQGQLSNNDKMADGQYDFIFTLYTASIDGEIISGTTALSDTIQVNQGIFSTLLDFGPPAFLGEAAWLEIRVRAAGVGSYVTLSPRQQLSPTPYAIYATNTPWGGITGLPDEFEDGVDNDTIYTAGDGLTLTDGAFSIDKTAIQTRVTGTCPNGQTIQAIAEDGTVTCSAGADISNVQTRVTGVCPAGESIQAIAEDGTVTCELDDIGLINPVSFLEVNGGANGGIAALNQSDDFITVLIENSGIANAMIARNAGSTFPTMVVENTSANSRIDIGSTIGVYASTSNISSPSMLIENTAAKSVVSIGSESGIDISMESDSAPAILVDNAATNSQIDIGGEFGIRASTGVEGETGILGFSNDGVESDINDLFENNRTGSSGAKFVGGHGVLAVSNATGVGYAVAGIASHKDGNTASIGVFGAARDSASGTNLAGLFWGDVEVDGDLDIKGRLSKSSGSFKIDHPLDPANKYLYHSFIESPDMMNVYNGNVVLDSTGSGVVLLPSYFEALNRDFRYQLTSIGAPGPNLHIAEKISNNQFRIAGGQPGSEVSWQVTGVRKDPYAEANRLQVEVAKPANEIGTYLYPELYGQPTSLSTKAQQLQSAIGDEQTDAEASNAEDNVAVEETEQIDKLIPEEPSHPMGARRARR